MDNIEVKVITNTSGDWEQLYFNDELYYEGHSIPASIWLKLLRRLGLTTNEIELEICDNCGESTSTLFGNLCDECYDEQCERDGREEE